jgi:hypothetical protein
VVLVINVVAGAFVLGLVLALMTWAIATQSPEDGIAPRLRRRSGPDRHVTRARRPQAHFARRLARSRRRFALRRGYCDLVDRHF